jgi:hypothetical protein
VKEDRNCWAGQDLPLKGMAHVPGGKGAGGNLKGAPNVMTDDGRCCHCAWDTGWGPVHGYLVLSSLI